MAEISDPQTLRSSSGFLAPTYWRNIDTRRGYNLGSVRVHCDGSRTRPLRDSLPAFTAPRGLLPPAV